MAPKKNRKQAQETMLEEPIENRVVPPESIREEEPRTREDQDELKMNRPDFSELVAALIGGHPRMRDINRPSSRTSMVPTTERLWMFGLWRWRIIYMSLKLDGIWPWNLPNLT